MQVRISTISPQGLVIQDYLPLAPLNKRMNEAKDNDIEFSSPPQVDLVITKSYTGAQVRGTVVTKVRQRCARCDEIVEHDTDATIELVLEPQPASGQAASDEIGKDYEDDIGIAYYKDDHYDLEDAIQEALILKLSPFWHPPCSKDGCCKLCKRNISEELKASSDKPLTLGTLLDKASHTKKGPQKG